MIVTWKEFRDFLRGRNFGAFNVYVPEQIMYHEHEWAFHEVNTPDTKIYKIMILMDELVVASITYNTRISDTPRIRLVTYTGQNRSIPFYDLNSLRKTSEEYIDPGTTLFETEEFFSNIADTTAGAAGKELKELIEHLIEKFDSE